MSASDEYLYLRRAILQTLEEVKALRAENAELKELIKSGVPDTGTVTPAVQIVLNFYDDNPEAIEKSVREVAALAGVGKSTVSRANQIIKRQ
jgi:hypothetical protein